MNRIIVLLLSLLVITSHSWADVSSPTEFTEADASPSVFDPWKVSVSNGTLTDNGDGSISITTGGGSGTPGGANAQIQYNDASSFGGDTSLSWNENTNTLYISRDASQTGLAIGISSDNGTTILANISHDGSIYADSLQLNTSLVVIEGGTGASTHTDGAILLGDGTSAITNTGVLTKGVLLVGDGTTDPTLLTVGANGTILSADSAETSGVKWSSIAQNKVFMNFPVMSAKLSADSTVRIDGGLAGGATPFTMWRLLYNDGTNNTSSNIAIWQGRMDDNWQGGPLTAKIDYVMISSDSTSTANGNITYGVSVWAITSGDAASLTTESYGTENTKTQVVPTVMSRDETVTIPLTNLDSLAAGDFYVVKLRRAGNDTITGDAAVVSFAVTE